MKKLCVVLLLFVLVFGVGFVGAASCGVGNDNKLIMRLSSMANAHGAAWGYTGLGYDTEICYTGTGVLDRGEGIVLFLSGSFNGHASSTETLVYDVPVGFGDASCQYYQGGCLLGTTCAVTLSGASNAHLAECSVVGSYSSAICCGSVAAGSVYWADMNGNLIGAEGADLGDSVQMIVVGGSAVDVFEIFEYDTFDDSEIRVGVDNISGVVDDGNLVGVWTITQADLNAADDDYDRFFFRVVGFDDSGYLKVNPSRDDDDMSISIVSPDCGDDFNEGALVDIEVSASDPDDNITGTLTIGGVEVETFSNGGITLSDYPFNDAGNVQVVAEAVNSRGERSRSVVNVMVLDRVNDAYVEGNEYVAACIDSPEDYTSFPGSEVEFDASTSRAVEIVGGESNVIIPGGNGGDRLSWYWTFYYPGGDEIIRNRPSVLGSDVLEDYKFNAEFPVAGDNSATLRLELD